MKFRRGVHCYILITALMFIFSKFFSFKFFGQIWSQNLKFFKLTRTWESFNPSCFLHIDGITSYLHAKLQQIWRTTDFGMTFSPNIYEWQILRKVTQQNLNQHTTICPCTKLQSIWRTLDFS